MENWTIEELAERVADALAAGYPGQPSARVREVPDRRTIRWYTTTGLVDRPAAMRGRTALYSRRHLLQLVAIKRLQARGRSLADIQEQLLNADDRTLEDVAALPPATAGSTGARTEAPARTRFWATPASPASPAEVAEVAEAVRLDGHAPPPARPAPLHDSTTVVPAIRLDGVTLLLDSAHRTPTPGELAALRTAAAPLLDLLHQLDLTEGTR
jgi:DNA-binding transcriptional MerR regulator